MVGKGGVEPPRLTAQDPKSCLSANSSTPPENQADLHILNYYTIVLDTSQA